MRLPLASRPVARLLAALVPLLLAAPPAASRGSAADEGGDFTERAREHYRRVELELAGRERPELAPERRARREALIEALARYRERADFGRNLDFPGARVPYFVDPGGRRCAVAHLLHVSGEDELVLRVARTANHAFVAELAEDPALAEWLERVGLELVEAARIQVPAGIRDQPSMLDGPWSGGAEPSGSAGSRPEAGAASGRPATSPPPAPAASSGPRSAEGSGGAAVSGGLVAQAWSLLEDPWWIWWEMNKLEYLRPNRLAARVPVLTGYDFRAGLEPDLAAELRGPLARRLVEELRHPAAEVRASAALALARLLGPDALFFLRDSLSDPSALVREHTLLALGAAGGERSVELLVNVARHGHPSDPRGKRLTPRAREIALVALGLLRRRGVDASSEERSLELLSELSRAPEDELALALMLHQTLAPSEALVSAAVQFAEGEAVGTLPRARALETQRGRSDTGALALLSRALHGRRLDLRQSAALTLGELEHELSLPTLQTAFELESEPTTRGLLLLAIGRRGGEGAREFLLEALREERRGLGHWAALALGMLARESDDDAARAAVRAAYASVTNPEHRGAYLLALGIARDRAALPLAVAGLASGNQRTRMHAALGLGMIGDEGSREALLARLASERADLVRVGLVHALGAIGDPRDGGRLVQAVRELRRSDLQGVMAVALAFHGSRHVLEGLSALALGGGLDSAGRAATWNALGLLLAREPGLELAQLSRQSNFTLYPSWVHELLQVTL